MKICLISPNPTHLQDIGQRLQTRGHQVIAEEGGKTRMRELADRDLPDLMLVDGMCCEPAELGHVEYVTARHPQVAVVLLCASQTPEFLIGAMRAGVREVLDSPPQPGALDAAIERIESKRVGGGRKSAQVLAFMSAKGGSGATFMATNLGWQLAERQKVLLMDLNLQFGDALSFVHDGRPATTLAHLARDTHRLDGSLLNAGTVKVSPQFSVLAAPEDIGSAVEITPAQVDAVLNVARSQYDFVLLDVPRSLDPVVVRSLDTASRIYLVMQATVPDVRHASRLIAAFKSLGYAADAVELVLNRFERSSEIGLEEVQKALGPVKVHTVPNSYREVRSAIDHGEPIAKMTRGSTVARQLASMALALQPRQETSRGLLGRLFRTA